MRCIWLARHGSRIDHEDTSWLETAARPFDPPITELGLAQAEKLGQRLKDKNVDCIISSPYLRTLQTANIAAEILQLPIYVEPGLGEFLFSTHFSETPDLPELAEMQKQFSHIDINYEGGVFPEYPESWEKLLVRSDETIQYLLKNFTKDILIITHGSPIIAMTKALTGTSCIMPYYCGLSKIVQSEEKWLVKMSGDILHLRALQEDDEETF